MSRAAAGLVCFMATVPPDFALLALVQCLRMVTHG
jgi:hypothetical protein